MVPLVAPMRGTTNTSTRAEIGAALHAVPDALYNHRYECCRISCVLQDFEHSVLAVLVLASKHVCHLLCASIDLSKVVVYSVVAQLRHNMLRNNTCKQEELCLMYMLGHSAESLCILGSAEL